jgi:hypothetical protein
MSRAAGNHDGAHTVRDGRRDDRRNAAPTRTRSVGIAIRKATHDWTAQTARSSVCDATARLCLCGLKAAKTCSRLYAFSAIAVVEANTAFSSCHACAARAYVARCPACCTIRGALHAACCKSHHAAKAIRAAMPHEAAHLPVWRESGLLQATRRCIEKACLHCTHARGRRKWMEKASSGNCAPPPCLSAQPRRGGPVAAVGGNIARHCASIVQQDTAGCRGLQKIAHQCTTRLQRRIPGNKAEMSQSTKSATGNDGRARLSLCSMRYNMRRTNSQRHGWSLLCNESPTSRSAAAAAVNTTY